MTNSTRANLSRSQRWLYTSAGIMALLAIWAFIAYDQHEYIMPSPRSTWDALLQILGQNEFWAALALSLVRAIAGLGIALLVGALWGGLMGRSAAFEAFCQPLLQILLATPAIVFVIIALVWFGSGTKAVIAVVAMAASPLVAKATAAAVSSMNRDLHEMATVFGLRRTERLWQITVPLVIPPFLAAATVALGQSLRVTVMAELLATASGLGGAIRLAQINIETPQIFAYALVLACLALLIERTLAAPVQRRFTRTSR